MFTVRIWDLPTRLFHWTLAICVFGSLITGHIGGSAMDWHFRLGYTVLCLVVFRLVWGFVGGHWSRWSQLTLRPLHVVAYLRGKSPSEHLVGHNPFGSWAILGIFMFLCLQLGSGLISDDEISNAGPFTSFVSSQWATLATNWHKNWGKWSIFILIGTHSIALLWYYFRKNLALVPPMIHGDKHLTQSFVASVDNSGTRCMAMLIFSAIALTVLAFGYFIS